MTKKKKETRKEDRQLLEMPEKKFHETIGEWLDGSDWVGKWIKKGEENEKENE